MKILKWVLIVLVSLFVIAFLLFEFVMKPQTKKHSPEDAASLATSRVNISVTYSQPSVKGRDIFSDSDTAVVPWGVVWRTGANEATTFETDKSLKIGENTLAAGKYTLWTIPNKTQWEVIFNDKMYGWGVSFGGVASRKAEHDAANIEVPVQTLSNSLEKFTITVQEQSGDTLQMNLAWNETQVTVPMILD